MRSITEELKICQKPTIEQKRLLTVVDNSNMISLMGRKKKGYKAPEGLIQQAGSPNWYIKWRHIYKSTKTPDLEKARLIFVEVQKMVLTEELRAKEILGKSIPFCQLIEKYLKEITPSKRSARADKTNSIYPLKYFSEKRIDDITTQEIYRYQDWRKSFKGRYGKPVSGSTINREISLISDAFRKAIRWGYVETNPCIGIERFSESSRERYITDKELDDIKNVALQKDDSEHLADIIDALYYTGQRSGRILSLKWTQIDLKERSVTFQQTSKNKRVPDVIWISDPLLAILYRLKGKRTLAKVVGSYVFQKLDGTPYKSVKTTWKRCCVEAGVRDIRINDIRHKAITDMLNAGAPISKVKTAVGHSHTSTTDGYTHLQVEATKEALESLLRKRT